MSIAGSKCVKCKRRDCSVLRCPSLGGVNFRLESEIAINPSPPSGIPGTIPSKGGSSVISPDEAESRLTILGGIPVGAQKRHGSCGPFGCGRGAPELCVALRYGEYGGTGVAYAYAMRCGLPNRGRRMSPARTA